MHSFSSQVTTHQQSNFKKQLRHFLKNKVYAPHVYDVIMLDDAKADGKKALQLSTLKLTVAHNLWGRKDPKKWLNLLKKLRDEAEESWPIMKLQQINKLAANAGLKTQEEVNAFLAYYHAVQEIIHDQEGGVVVLAPQWLYDVSR